MAASVVLNGARSTTRVSQQTRQRILDAAARLQYRRNAAALGLSRSRMHTLGVAGVAGADEINLYFMELLHGVVGAAADCEETVKVFALTDWSVDQHRIVGFCDGRIDGMILIGPRLSAEVAANLAGATPFVAIHSDAAIEGAWCLEADDEGGARAATEHLVRLGHRRVLHLAGPADYAGAQRRLAGYHKALDEAGIRFEERLVIPGAFIAESGKERMAQFLHAPPAVLPSAVFCANDAIAAGCIEAITAAGLGVPHDISVAGFDDTLVARVSRPALTTIRQPLRQMGRRAVELLLKQIDERQEEAFEILPAPGGIVEFPVELVVRESTRPPSRHPQAAGPLPPILP